MPVKHLAKPVIGSRRQRPRRRIAGPEGQKSITRLINDRRVSDYAQSVTGDGHAVASSSHWLQVFSASSHWKTAVRRTAREALASFQ